jgi:putative transposase
MNILIEGIATHRVKLHAYCIMRNHYHLLLSIPLGELTPFMHYLGSAYGSYLRWRAGVVGHIFAGRYQSICVDRERYLLELGRYIHLNPVRAGIVHLPEQYPWSSYSSLIGLAPSCAWLDENWLTEAHGGLISHARLLHRRFVEEGLDNQGPYPVGEITAQSILGGKEFTRRVLRSINPDLEFDEVTGKRIFLRRTDMDGIYNSVCRYYNLDDLSISKPEDISSKRLARNMFIFLAREYTAASGKDIVEKIGGICPSGITHHLGRMAGKLLRGNKTARQLQYDIAAITSIFKG